MTVTQALLLGVGVGVLGAYGLTAIVFGVIVGVGEYLGRRDRRRRDRAAGVVPIRHAHRSSR